MRFLFFEPFLFSSFSKVLTL